MKCAFCSFSTDWDVELGLHHYKAHIFPKPKIDLVCPVCSHLVPDVLQHFEMMHKDRCSLCAQTLAKGSHSCCEKVKERGRINYCHWAIFLN